MKRTELVNRLKLLIRSLDEIRCEANAASNMLTVIIEELEVVD